MEPLENPGRLPLATASIGIVLTYFTEKVPQSLTLDWDLFNPQLQQVSVTALDPVSEFTSYVTVTPANPTFSDGLIAVPQDIRAGAFQLRFRIINL